RTGIAMRARPRCADAARRRRLKSGLSAAHAAASPGGPQFGIGRAGGLKGSELQSVFQQIPRFWLGRPRYSRDKAISKVLHMKEFYLTRKKVEIEEEGRWPSTSKIPRPKSSRASWRAGAGRASPKR